MQTQTTIFSAKKIITMYPEFPYAKAVAVKDGRILGFGELSDMVHWVKNSPFTPYEVDTTFEDKILMPGLVDAHTHVDIQALIYSGHFVSQIPWPKPEGGFFPTYPTKEAVFNRLKELDRELPPGELLFGVAYDENKTGESIHISELDEISSSRPVLITNSVFHRFWANSFLLEKAGVTPDNIPAGVRIGNDGRPDGTLLEGIGLSVVIGALPDLVNINAEKIRRILPLFTAAGNTTVTEMTFGNFGLDHSHGVFQDLFADPEVRLRVVGTPYANTNIAMLGSTEKFVDKVHSLRESNTDKLRIGAVKLFADGSIISRTAYVGWPGYWDGTPQGSWSYDPEQQKERIVELHTAGLSTITHSNSRPAIQAVLDGIEMAQVSKYRPDMRHRIDHCYNITEAQLRRAKDLGVGVQFFTPQIYYYGDAHIKIQGPTRANCITPTGTAKRLDVSWGFHNDPPGTPQLPWVGAWSTVQRRTESGAVLGPDQRVNVEDVLRVMTIEHAYQLHLDREIGSIEFGKKADFCVLEADPLEIDPDELKDIPVWGTVFGGEPHPAK